MKFIENRNFIIQFTNKEFKLIAKTACAMRYEHRIIDDQLALVLSKKELEEFLCLLEIRKNDLQRDKTEQVTAIKLGKLILELEDKYNNC